MKKLDKCLKLMGLSLLIVLNSNLFYNAGIFGIKTNTGMEMGIDVENFYSFLNMIGFIVFIIGLILMIKEMIGYLLHWFRN